MKTSKKLFNKKNLIGVLGSLTLCSALGISTNAAALDVVIILDTTGSTGALLPNWQANMEASIINPIKAVDPNARFALISHLDFPFSPYGVTGEYAYRVESPLNSNIAPLLTALSSLTSGSGGDTKESQLEAIYQANTGLGLDLNGNGSYTDTGDILPAPLGFNPLTNSFTIHFTSPLDYHNDPLEPNYPYTGVVNNPADYNDALAALAANNNTYFALTPNPLLATGSSTALDFSGSSAGAALTLDSTSTAERLAAATGGEVLGVGSDLSGVEEAMEEIIDIVRPCPPGEIPVELPIGVACVPEAS